MTSFNKLFILISILLFLSFGFSAGTSAAQLPQSGDSSYDCTSQSAISEVECLALVSLFEQTDGENWVDHTNWLQNDDPCSWYGITCDAGAVTEISLFDNELSGEIPTELANLSSLTILILSSNNLTGSIPDSFATLPTLSTLALGGNQLSGTIPASLGQIENLVILALSDNNFTGNIPAALSALAHLEYLGLAFNQLSGELPTELGDLTDLKAFTIEFNQISGEIPQSFTHLTALEEFDYIFNYLCVPQTTEFQAWLGAIEIVRGDNVSCTFCQQESMELPEEECEAILALSAGTDSKMWDEPWRWGAPDQCALYGVTCQDGHVTALALESNNLIGTIPPEIGNFSQLELLNLSSNSLSGELPTQFYDLHNLVSINLEFNLLSGTISTRIGELSNLEEINLIVNQFEGSIPGEIGALTSLTSLWLTENNFSGTMPPELSELTNLDSLILINTNLTGSVPLTYTNIPGLTTFTFANTDVCVPTNLRFTEWLGNIANRDNSFTYCESSLCETQSAIPAAECSALENFYGAAIGFEWTNQTNWFQNNDPCTWFGISCTDGSISGIELSNNNLTYQLSANLPNLPNLTTLKVDTNALAGSIPTNYTELSSLETFHYFDTNLCIPYDADFLSWLAGVDNVSGNNVSCDTTNPTGSFSSLAAGDELLKPRDHIFVLAEDTQSGVNQVTLYAYYTAGSGGQWHLLGTAENNGTLYKYKLNTQSIPAATIKIKAVIQDHVGNTTEIIVEDIGFTHTRTIGPGYSTKIGDDQQSSAEETPPERSSAAQTHETPIRRPGTPWTQLTLHLQ